MTRFAVTGKPLASYKVPRLRLLGIKEAVVSLTTSAALELAHRRIRHERPHARRPSECQPIDDLVECPLDGSKKPAQVRRVRAYKSAFHSYPIPTTETVPGVGFEPK